MNKRRVMLRQQCQMMIGVGLLLLLLQNHAVAEDMQIWHNALNDAKFDTPLRIEFKAQSAVPLREARIYFKARQAQHFYYIHATPQTSGRYEGILPGADSTVEQLDYVLLLVDTRGRAVKSSRFSVAITDTFASSKIQRTDLQTSLVVFAEQAILPEIGFSGEYITWALTMTQENAYLNQADEVEVQPDSSTDKIGTIGNKFKNLSSRQKIIVGAGVGLGAAALVAVLAGGGGEQEKSIWDEIEGDIAENVTASIVKTPEIQTTCGTVVTNQLFVTNSTAEDLMLGTIDYEIILTKDKPTGSCEAGRTGAFAPNLSTVIPPGEPILIREWMNEVNPCSGCPYVVAECEWESRYIVHTSAGSAVTYAIFASQGNLCGTSAAKSRETGNMISGDVEP